MQNSTNGAQAPQQQKMHLTAQQWAQVYKEMDFRLFLPNLMRSSKKKMFRLVLMAMGHLGFVLKTNGNNIYSFELENPTDLKEFRDYINENLDTLGLKSKSVN